MVKSPRFYLVVQHFCFAVLRSQTQNSKPFIEGSCSNMINMGELQLVHALGLEIPSQKLLDRLGDQVLNPPCPRARIPLGPRNQLHQFYQGYPTDSDSDDDEDDEDDEDYDDYLMAAPNTVPAVPGQAIGPAIEGANWTVDGTGNLAALTGEGKESAAIQDRPG